jgi:hypothetical protein
MFTISLSVLSCGGWFKTMHVFQGIKMGRNEYLTHLLFAYGILIFCYCTKVEGKVVKNIMDLFCGATCMVINLCKSSMYFPEFEVASHQYMSALFSLPSHNLHGGLKYLGYNIKPNNYGFDELKWILCRIKKRINL